MLLNNGNDEECCDRYKCRTEFGYLGVDMDEKELLNTKLNNLVEQVNAIDGESRKPVE